MEKRSYIKTNLQGLASYQTPPTTASVLLDRNELPFNLPKTIIDRICEEIKTLSFNRYPTVEETCGVTNLLAEKLGVLPENILLGVGSSELLQGLCNAIGEIGDGIAIPTPSFPMFTQYILLSDKKVIPISLDELFQIKINELKMILEEHNPKMIIIPNPNNPTGNLFSEEVFAYLLNEFKGVICIDEVYYEYCGKTYIEEIKHRDNVVIIRSFSKAGLAGCRIGYLVASSSLVQGVQKAILPYNMNSLSLLVAKIFLQEENQVSSNIKQTIAEREYVADKLKTFSNIHVYPSCTNFLLCEFSHKPKALVSFLNQEHNLAVRPYFPNSLLANCLRITIGTPEENCFFVSKIKDFYEQYHTTP